MTNISDAVDVIDAAVPLAPDQAAWALRRQRDKVVAATQGSYDAMFSSSVEGLSVAERLLVALLAQQAGGVAGHQRHRGVDHVEGKRRFGKSGHAFR